MEVSGILDPEFLRKIGKKLVRDHKVKNLRQGGAEKDKKKEIKIGN